jgi:hypothetical protein
LDWYFTLLLSIAMVDPFRQASDDRILWTAVCGSLRSFLQTPRSQESLPYMGLVSVVISNTDLKAENSLGEPMKVAPVEKSLTVSAPQFSYTLLPSSLTVLRVGVPK